MLGKNNVTMQEKIQSNTTYNTANTYGKHVRYMEKKSSNGRTNAFMSQESSGNQNV